MTGSATPALATGDPIPPDTWLTLAAGARLTAKDPRTTRETAFEGPGRVQPCVGFDEASYVASGTFVAGGGAERPGAEEWVSTPFGVVRYGGGVLTVAVSDKKADVTVQNGVAHVWAADDVEVRGKPAAPDAQAPDDPGWIRLDAGAKAALVAKGTPEAAKAVDRCAALAEAAHTSAHAVMTAAHPDGALAAKNVLDRRAARAACGVAHVRAESQGTSAQRDAVAAADERWRKLSD